MVSDVASSTAGAAVGIQQGLAQQNFGVKALNQQAQQDGTVVSLLQAGPTDSSFSSFGGGNVTPTRGQNLNITV